MSISVLDVPLKRSDRCIYEQMKKEEKVDAYAIWSTDVDPKNNPIPLEASSEQESSIFSGRGSETSGTPQNSEDTIRPCDGSGLSGPNGGKGGGLTTEPRVTGHEVRGAYLHGVHPSFE